jgi:hypothetical protein
MYKYKVFIVISTDISYFAKFIQYSAIQVSEAFSDLNAKIVLDEEKVEQQYKNESKETVI